ncbi:hypothetical protein SO802_026518 [Lithocarpus litseifolius]|uniref:Uncharacterized protein n=1 Tax=Lithocarpus litseifolius TaxID=425828 RepID=A0AAW2C213_9ROSI
MISAKLYHLTLALVLGQTIAKGVWDTSKRDKLLIVGVHIEDEELLHIVLDGLPQGYYSFSSALRTRDDPIGYKQAHVLLTIEEKSLKHASELIKDPVHMAMIVQGPTPNSCPPIVNGQFQAYRGRGRSTNN